MPVDNEAASRKARRIAEATAKGQTLFRGSDRVAEFDRACDHIVQLLRDSSLLYEAGSFGTSVFVAITALEEKTKIEVTMYRATDPTAAVPRREDALFSHREKHAISLQEVLLISGRLEDAVDVDVARQFLKEAENGQLVRLRGSSLYIEDRGEGLVVPSAVVDKSKARAILLLAIEAANDCFTGMTNHSWKLGDELDAMFTRVAAS